MRTSRFEFQSIEFHPGSGAEARVRCVGDAVPYKNGGIGGEGLSPPTIEKMVTNLLFCSDFGENLLGFQTFSELFEQFKKRVFLG